MSASDGRDRVLGAALELIARDGFDGVRIADIAKRAGVSAALVHYHFANRAQLLTEALARSLSAAEARLQRTTDDAHRQAPPERLADLIDFGLPMTPEDVLELRLWAELELRASGSAELSRTLAVLNERLLRPLTDVVTAGLEQGVFHGCVPEEVATVALALTGGLCTRLMAVDPTLTLAEARRLAGRQIAMAVGFHGELPFQPLPAGTGPGDDPGESPARRRRAPSPAARP